MSNRTILDDLSTDGLNYNTKNLYFADSRANCKSIEDITKYYHFLIRISKL